MAQDFEGAGIRVSNSETVLRTVDSDDAVVGIRVANITTAAVTLTFMLNITMVAVMMTITSLKTHLFPLVAH